MMNALCEEISDNPDKSHVSNLRYQLTALSLPSPGFLSFLTRFLGWNHESLANREH